MKRLIDSTSSTPASRAFNALREGNLAELIVVLTGTTLQPAFG